MPTNRYSDSSHLPNPCTRELLCTLKHQVTTLADVCRVGQPRLRPWGASCSPGRAVGHDRKYPGNACKPIALWHTFPGARPFNTWRILPLWLGIPDSSSGHVLPCMWVWPSQSECHRTTSCRTFPKYSVLDYSALPSALKIKKKLAKLVGCSESESQR